MEVNSTNSNSQVFVGDPSRGLQNGADRGGDEAVEEKAAFADAAKVDITDPNGKRDERSLSAQTEQFLSNNSIEMAKESANFDKQSILAIAGSMTAAQGQANVGAARALLS